MILREVDSIPERLEPNVLYVSRKYATASHLCACGCGVEVVTPLGNGGWQVWSDRQGVSMSPSIGNWSFKCQSHYFVRNGSIEWARAFSPSMIEAARRADNPRAYESRDLRPGWLSNIRSFFRWLLGR